MTRTTLFLAVSCLMVACAEPEAEVDEAPVEEMPELSDAALVVDFGLAGERSWFAVNDTVMGGVSEGEVSYSNDPDEIAKVFGRSIDVFLDAGALYEGPSTVVDLTGDSPVVIREGSGSTDWIH